MPSLFRKITVLLLALCCQQIARAAESSIFESQALVSRQVAAFTQRDRQKVASGLRRTGGGLLAAALVSFTPALLQGQNQPSGIAPKIKEYKTYLKHRMSAAYLYNAPVMPEESAVILESERLSFQCAPVGIMSAITLSILQANGKALLEVKLKMEAGQWKAQVLGDSIEASRMTISEIGGIVTLSIDTEEIRRRLGTGSISGFKGVPVGTSYVGILVHTQGARAKPDSSSMQKLLLQAA